MDRHPVHRSPFEQCSCFMSFIENDLADALDGGMARERECGDWADTLCCIENEQVGMFGALMDVWGEGRGCDCVGLACTVIENESVGPLGALVAAWKGSGL